MYNQMYCRGNLNRAVDTSRGVPLLVPFLAGAIVGPLFFNGFNNNNQSHMYPYYPAPYYPPYYPYM